jgi:hypothetical protein
MLKKITFGIVLFDLSSLNTMIAKIIPIKSVRKSNYSALIQYLTDPQDKSERISQINVSNCYSDDLMAGLLEIQNTQEMNTRAKSDKTCHLVLSFPEGERLSLSDLNAIEERFCDALGFNGHQRISVVHDDTNNLHMHIAINKIHPRTLTIHNPYYDFKKVAKLCEQIEQEYGLTKVNHETVSDKAARVAQEIEARTGVESLLGWIKREALTEIKDTDNWQDLHQVLARHGLEIKERGNGFVLVANNGVAVKASSVDRSLSKGNLTQRLGAFIPSEHSAKSSQQNTKQYQPRPLQNRIDTSKLYARYQQEQSDSPDSEQANGPCCDTQGINSLNAPNEKPNSSATSLKVSKLGDWLKKRYTQPLISNSKQRSKSLKAITRKPINILKPVIPEWGGWIG